MTPSTSCLRSRTTVRSHPQAFGQCRRFLERCLPNAHQSAALSTAGAVIYHFLLIVQIAKIGSDDRAEFRIRLTLSCRNAAERQQNNGGKDKSRGTRKTTHAMHPRAVGPASLKQAYLGYFNAGCP